MEVEHLDERNYESSDDEVQIFGEEDEPGNPEDEAIEVPDTEAAGEAKVIKPKRVIKNPQPKLDAIRLMGPRGVGIIQSSFKDIKFKGKGHEREDLRLLMKKLEHWAHRLFPKMPFDDTLKQIEKLGIKKPVQNMVKRIRLDMFQADEMNGLDDQKGDKPPNEEVEEVDVFDELLSTGPFAEKRSESISSQNTTVMFPPTSQISTPSVLTQEQRERMEKNRLIALEKRKARLLQQQKENEEKSLTNTEPSNNNFNIFNETSNPFDTEIQTINKDKFKPVDTTEENESITDTEIHTINEDNFKPVDATPEEIERMMVSHNEMNIVLEENSLNNETTNTTNPLDKSPVKDVVNQMSNDDGVVTEDDLLGLINSEEANL